jgi:hypothetical protein
MADRIRTREIQDTYWTSKSIKMKRYINRKESLPCPIDQEMTCKYFQETWGFHNKLSLKQEKAQNFPWPKNYLMTMLCKR